LPQGGLKERKKKKEKKENGLPMVEKSSLLMEELHNLDAISRVMRALDRQRVAQLLE
jgi:hypothetical protein